MYDVIILGGGPAGLTATMYALQKRLDTLLITRDLGGKTNYTLQLPFVERHMAINGDEVLRRFMREIEYLDYVHVQDNAEEVETVPGGYRVSTTGGGDYEARALIVATGSKAQLLNVPGEREFMMRGLCYSAISYAHLFADRNVVVIGDGELALRAVAELARSARQVTLVAGADAELNTSLGLSLGALAQVEFVEGCEVKQIKGDTYARSVILNGSTGQREISMDGLFVEKDLLPRSDIVASLVACDSKGHIQINSRNETSASGIFAAGDVTTTFSEQVLISIGEGAKAALSAYDYLLLHEQVMVKTNN